MSMVTSSRSHRHRVICASAVLNSCIVPFGSGKVPPSYFSMNSICFVFRDPVQSLGCFRRKLDVVALVVEWLRVLPLTVRMIVVGVLGILGWSPIMR